MHTQASLLRMAQQARNLQWDKAIDLIHVELVAAEHKHPGWPDSVERQLLVINEEMGELNKEVLDKIEDPNRKTDKEINKEAAQTAAMLIRFLMGRL